MMKNIILTFEVRTAATDGIRVFFNPAFADRLFSLDSLLISKRMKTNPNIDPEEINGTMFQFVLIHEIYHQIYRHMHRIRMKPETASALIPAFLNNLATCAACFTEAQNTTVLLFLSYLSHVSTISWLRSVTHIFTSKSRMLY